MSDYDYSPTSSPTYNREQATLWVDNYDSSTGWTKKNIYKDESLSLPINNNEQHIYIKQLEEKIAKQQEVIYKQEQTIKQLSNTYSEFVTILTRLWNKSFNIDISKTREEIKEILKIWYEKEWLDVL
jgi:hypothetical protein